MKPRTPPRRSSLDPQPPSPPGHAKPLPPKMGLARKYAQHEPHSHRPLHKQYREVVMSQQFVKSHKLYKLLKQQMAVSEARHAREARELGEQLETEEAELRAVREGTHGLKVQLWELRNRAMEMRALWEEEDQESRRLVGEWQRVVIGYAEAEQAMGEGEEGELCEHEERQEQESEGNQVEVDVQGKIHKREQQPQDSHINHKEEEHSSQYLLDEYSKIAISPLGDPLATQQLPANF